MVCEHENRPHAAILAASSDMRRLSGACRPGEGTDA